MNQIIQWMKEIYILEDRCKRLSPEEKQKVRINDMKPLYDKLKASVDKEIKKVPPKTKYGEALHYLNNQWTEIERCLEQPYYPLDNNLSENAIRPFVVGRKFVCRKPSGAKASAMLYSLVETAKANDIEYAYLEYLLHLPYAQTQEKHNQEM